MDHTDKTTDSPEQDSGEEREPYEIEFTAENWKHWVRAVLGNDIPLEATGYEVRKAVVTQFDQLKSELGQARQQARTHFNAAEARKVLFGS